ncbi:inosine/guanosine kinase [Alkalimonas collagenimarina]|uniref:Inosine/guanosine kinase n=1 Tax=Alkalimonas collagenimarina TaxID=400390 RepID=A0ABT9H1S7_9GAMM|nr:inosine/guanosine kinase [Alkalimonas collagenimarina]MDP4537271.1 inosine/guanosine kinase [Alkalimonas collagenimarina]
MKFPGHRKIKHYFPVSAPKPELPRFEVDPALDTYVVGLDQVIVDVVAKVSDEFLQRYGIGKGLSNLVEHQQADAIYQELLHCQAISDHFAGGTIGNTIHNYSVLADDKSVLLGVMSANITLGSPAYHYLCHTSSKVDLNHLHGVAGDIGRGITLITPDGERTFVIDPGDMDQLTQTSIPADLVTNASALVLSAYPLRATGQPIIAAMQHSLELANQQQVPVVMSLGTRHLVEELRTTIQQTAEHHIQILAMNEQEAEALTGLSEPLLAAEKILDWVDMVLITAGAEGLYLCGYTDASVQRETTHPIKSGALADFNRYEFSRPMLRRDCQQPVKVYSHIDPYMGGPERIANTNGAGDGALAAVLHDMAANHHHRQLQPLSSKHELPYLCYSSFAQICKYANRVSYEILVQYASRLSRGLPEREDSLEEAYWER